MGDPIFFTLNTTLCLLEVVPPFAPPPTPRLHEVTCIHSIYQPV